MLGVKSAIDKYGDFVGDRVGLVFTLGEFPESVSTGFSVTSRCQLDDETLGLTEMLCKSRELDGETLGEISAILKYSDDAGDTVCVELVFGNSASSVDSGSNVPCISENDKEKLGVDDLEYIGEALKGEALGVTSVEIRYTDSSVDIVGLLLSLGDSVSSTKSTSELADISKTDDNALARAEVLSIIIDSDGDTL